MGAPKKKIKRKPKPATRRFQPFLLILFTVGSLSLGSLGSLVTYDKIPTWYAALNKPWFSPPNWLFGPVWTLLYAMIGLSAYLVFTSGSSLTRRALSVFSVQFVLNILWSFLFFGLTSPILGLVGIALLWVSIIATMTEFSRISRFAAYLLLPYLAWVTFAMFLNTAIVILN